ncbi:hypothetical protein [Pontibacillus halophilus]|nr:hypothetical protein [Pontibacillus halophilus]
MSVLLGVGMAFSSLTAGMDTTSMSSATMAAFGQGGGADVETEFVQYVEEDLVAIQQEEQVAIDTFNQLVSDPNVQAGTLVSTMESEVLPRYEKVVNGLKLIEPEAEELKNIHQTYVSASEKQFEALTKVYQAVNNQEEALLDESDALFMEAETMLLEYETKLQTLASEYGMEYTSPYVQ